MFKHVASTLALFAAAALLSGCGATLGTGPGELSAASAALGGRVFGGQQPISGATIEFYAYGKASGTAGYGSAATLLATTTSNPDGTFSFATDAFTCPSTTTPVYLLSEGGYTGSTTLNATPNPAAVLGVGLGACGALLGQTSVQVNEVSTVALAFALSHFFSPSNGSTSTNTRDTFGGASSGNSFGYVLGLINANSNTVPALVSTSTGFAVTSSPTVTTESDKIYALANALASCVNSASATSNTCAALFAATTPPTAGAAAPTDTLQAAVNIALYPYQNVGTINGLGGSAAPFPALATAPPDWTLALSYTTAAMGLGVDTGTVSTLDVDQNGRVWFPSTAPAGVGFFDPATQAFSGPFNSTGMVHPQQVAISAGGYVYVADNGSDLLSNYFFTSPDSTFGSYTLAGYTTPSVVIQDSDAPLTGLRSAGGAGALAVVNSSNSYVLYKTFPNPVGAVSADTNGDTAVVSVNPTSFAYTLNFLRGTSLVGASATSTGYPGAAVALTGTYLSARPFVPGAGTFDGLCILTTRACYNFAGSRANNAAGMATDGAHALWFAENLNNAIEVTSASPSLNYLSGATVPVNEYIHGEALPNPAGIAVDGSGNVWVSNGCATTGCTPGPFVLTELVGAATPTYMPIAIGTVQTDTGPALPVN